jgi:hypothetical protein
MPPVELTSGNAMDGSTVSALVSIASSPASFVQPSARAKIGIIYPPPEVRSKFIDSIMKVMMNTMLIFD